MVVASIAYTNWATVLLRASRVNRSHFPMGLLLPFAVLAFLNLLVRRPGIARALSRGELRVILGLGLIGAFFLAYGLAGYLVGVIAAPYYFATPENRWADLLHGHVPGWAVLRNEDLAATRFYEGVPYQGAMSWGAWVGPLFWWLTLIGAVSWSLLCVMVILRKQWVEHERLEYPLMRAGMHLAI